MALSNERRARDGRIRDTCNVCADVVCADGSRPECRTQPLPYAGFLDAAARRKLGGPIGVEIDHSDGKTLWVFERCGADTCVGSDLPSDDLLAQL